MIYFDNAATTYPKPKCVYEAVDIGMKDFSFNAGRGSYESAAKTYKMIEETRLLISSLVDTQPNNVVFSSSATESLNNIIYGLKLTDDDYVFVSPFEHNAVIRTLHKTGAKIELLPFDRETWGFDAKLFNDLCVIKRPKAIIISHISNVTGFELPYKKIFEIGRKHYTINVLDCSQSYGIYAVSKENVDAIVFAGHKSLYASFGIAGYIKLTNFSLDVYKVGGTGSDSLNLNMPEELPLKFEAGSMNSVAIYSLNASIKFLKTKKFDIVEQELTEYLINRLKKMKSVKVYLPTNYISKGIVSFNVSGYKPDEVGMILGEDYNICVRTGYHCAPFIHNFLDTQRTNGTIRVSIGIFNTKTEIDALIDAINQL